MYLMTFNCTVALYTPPEVTHLLKHKILCYTTDLLQQDLADVLADKGLALVDGDFNACTRFASGTCMKDFSDAKDRQMDSSVNI